MALHLEYEMLNRTVFSLVRKELGLENAHFFPTAGAAVSAHVEEFVHSIGKHDSGLWFDGVVGHRIV